MHKYSVARIYDGAFDSLKDLDDKTYRECMDAYMAYSLDEVYPENISLMAKFFLDNNRGIIDDYHRKQRGGAKGGRPPKKTSTPSYDSDAYKKKARDVIEYKPTEKKG